MQKKQMKYIERILLWFNIGAVFAITIFIYITTNKICDQQTASEFLDQVKAIPWNPKGLIMIITLLLALLVFSYYLRRRWLKEYIRYQYVTLVIDLMVSLFIVYLLGFNYNGILLWVFACFISCIDDVKGQYVFVVIAIASYVGSDHGLASISSSVYSLDDYFKYYDMPAQGYIYGIFTIIKSLTIILFLMFCVYIILVQMGTIAEVERLYRKLSETNEDLQEANIELKEYANIKEKMGETKERNRLAREIHDTLGHTLTGISAGIDACITTIDYEPKGTKKQLEVISSLTREGIKEVRRSVNELRPDALERLSLENAIQDMISNFEKTTNTKIHFTCKKTKLQFDEDEENAIYRVIQESITNSVRHGKANNIYVNIKKEFSELVIVIKDDGIGAEKIEKGFGTRHILERVKNLNGTVEFDGSDGFKTKVVMPIRWGETYD
ncbi:sensor histidine kinase [Lachnospiraceae bacterium OttesenSCG-928-E19]|nr:sensor histidine kinase [Lachnospiraceae bacterium OttesenSCG-928-E19]